MEYTVSAFSDTLAPAFGSVSQGPMLLPDYDGTSIVNLMSSLVAGSGGEPDPNYPGLSLTDLDEAARVQTILLIVIDGMGDHFLHARAQGGALHGRRVGSLTSVFPSTTASAITSFLTGTAPQQHGLTGWFMFLAELADVYAVLPSKPRRGGMSFSRSGIEPKRIFDQQPVFDRLMRQSSVIVPQRIANSDYNIAHLGRATLKTYESQDDFFRSIAVAIHESEGPSFVYAYWPDLDSLAHEHGIGSAECATHLAQLDEGFGRLCRSLEGSDTLVLVTADHGMLDVAEDSSLELSDHPELARCLRLPLCGERRAPYCYVKPERREDFEDYLAENLSHCLKPVPSQRLIEQGLFGSGVPHPRLADRVGDYVLLMNHGYVLADCLPGEVRHRQIGVHGGLSPDEMRVPLIRSVL